MCTALSVMLNLLVFDIIDVNGLLMVLVEGI